MTLGYDKPLYILAFDHRGSFQKKFFGVAGEPNAEETARIADAKKVIYEGALTRARRGRRRARRPGVLVDEQFGAEIAPRREGARGSRSRCRVEKSGQEEFDFQYGEDFGAHIEDVRPELRQGAGPLQHRGRSAMNARQNERLTPARRVAARARSQVPVRAARPGRRREQLEAAGGDEQRWDSEERPQADEGGDRGAPGRRRRARRLEDRGHRPPRGLRDDRGGHPRGTGGTASRAWCSAAAPTTPRSTTGCGWGRACPVTSASRSAARSGGIR